MKKETFYNAFLFEEFSPSNIGQYGYPNFSSFFLVDILVENPKNIIKVFNKNKLKQFSIYINWKF